MSGEELPEDYRLVMQWVPADLETEDEKWFRELNDYYSLLAERGASSPEEEEIIRGLIAVGGLPPKKEASGNQELGRAAA